jgi:hypothetical protein
MILIKLKLKEKEFLYYLINNKVRRLEKNIKKEI